MKNNTHLSSLSHKRDRYLLEKRRLKAANLFTKGLTQVEVARQCRVSREAAHQWYSVWKKQGRDGLLSKGKPGPKSKLTEDKKARVEKTLLKGPKSFGFATEIWTLKRIAKVIQKVAKIKYHPGHVWYILQSMNWTCQKPITRVKERDERAIAHWKRCAWPNIKKKPRNLKQS